MRIFSTFSILWNCGLVSAVLEGKGEGETNVVAFEIGKVQR
jgi:hypothetical protein